MNRPRLLFSTLGALVLCASQALAIPITTLYSTGQAGTPPVANCTAGVEDCYYTLISGPGVYPTWQQNYPIRPKITVGEGDLGYFPFNTWTTNSSYYTTANWISPEASYYNPAVYDLPGNYTFQTQFTIPTNMDPTTVVLHGYISTDNALVDLVINGVSTGLHMDYNNPIPPGGWTHPTRAHEFYIIGSNATLSTPIPEGTLLLTVPSPILASIHPTFIQGINIINITVNNYDKTLLGSTNNYQNPAGMILQIEGWGEEGIPWIPEPGTFVMIGSALVGIAFLARHRFHKP